ncbi:MAG: hypothetical protein E6R06_26150 [Mycobacterium sp.]|nr:MAG: hypothetical protein E6R06_26150 [Mycobacterium sp.]
MIDGPRPLPPADADAFHDAQLAALAAVEASIDSRSGDLETILGPHLERPYWIVNAFLALSNSLLLGYDEPRQMFDQLRAALLTPTTEGDNTDG